MGARELGFGKVGIAAADALHVFKPKKTIKRDSAVYFGLSQT